METFWSMIIGQIPVLWASGSRTTCGPLLLQPSRFILCILRYLSAHHSCKRSLLLDELLWWSSCRLHVSFNQSGLHFCRIGFHWMFSCIMLCIIFCENSLGFWYPVWYQIPYQGQFSQLKFDVTETLILLDCTPSTWDNWMDELVFLIKYLSAYNWTTEITWWKQWHECSPLFFTCLCKFTILLELNIFQ